MVNLRKLSKFATMAGVATALGATVAHADVETFTGYYPGPALTDQVSTDWNGQSPYQIDLPTFNTALGTLTSVQLTFEGDVTSSGSIYNPGDTTVSVKQITVSASMYLMPAGYAFTGDVTLSDYQNDAADNALVVSAPALYTHNGTITLMSHASQAFSATNKTDTQSATLTSALSSYETNGLGSLLFPIVTDTSLLSSVSGGNDQLIQSTVAGAELIVTYTYSPDESPVPEPATLAVLGVGLAGLGLTRFRRR